MVDYRLIMKLLLQGRSYRQIQQQCGAAQATIAKARKALDANGISSVSDLEVMSNAAVAELVGDGRLVASDEFVDIDFSAVVKARSGRNKTPLRVLWSNYLDSPALPGRRFSCSSPWPSPGSAPRNFARSPRASTNTKA